MSHSLMGGVMSFAVVLVGVVTIAYAGDLAYDGADQEADVLDVFHPLAELTLESIVFVPLIIVAIALIGGVAWMLSQGNSNGGSFGGRR